MLIHKSSEKFLFHGLQKTYNFSLGGGWETWRVAMHANRSSHIAFWNTNSLNIIDWGSRNLEAFLWTSQIMVQLHRNKGECACYSCSYSGFSMRARSMQHAVQIVENFYFTASVLGTINKKIFSEVILSLWKNIQSWVNDYTGLIAL